MLFDQIKSPEVYKLSVTEDLLRLLEVTLDSDDHNSMVFFINAVVNEAKHVKIDQKLESLSKYEHMSNKIDTQYGDYHPI